MDIQTYITDLQNAGIIYTANIDIKNAILKYLTQHHLRYICNMDDNFQYTIQLV